MLLCTQIFQRDFAPLAEFLEDNTIVNALSCTVNLKLRSGTIYRTYIRLLFTYIWTRNRTNRVVSAHRRRIYTEEKAKVVGAVWGTEFSQLPAAPGRLKNRMNSSFS